MKVFSPGQVTPQWLDDRIEDTRFMDNEWTKLDVKVQLYRILIEAILEERCDRWRECLRKMKQWDK